MPGSAGGRTGSQAVPFVALHDRGELLSHGVPVQRPAGHAAVRGRVGGIGGARPSPFEAAVATETAQLVATAIDQYRRNRGPLSSGGTSTDCLSPKSPLSSAAANLLKLTAHGPDAAVLEERLNRARSAIVERIGAHIYAEGDVTLMEAVGRLLADGGRSVSVAESCTGGLLCHLITSVPGSSAWFERGLVVYSNISKTQLAGVEETILAQHGAVSAQTAQALAQGVRSRAASTWGIGITGIAGPEGGTPEKPVGTVFFAIAGPDGCRAYHRRFTGTREQIKLLSACTALDLLRRTLLGLSLDDHAFSSHKQE